MRLGLLLDGDPSIVALGQRVAEAEASRLADVLQEAKAHGFFRSAAERLFGRLLRLYPGEFRAEWGGEMTRACRFCDTVRGVGFDPDIAAYYAQGGEQARLDQGYFPLERARTQEIVLRHLPPPPAVVLDVGGAAGAYALWLAARGYEVHLIDPVALHVEQAARASAASAQALASASVGDARALAREDVSADAVLLLGPLYHLIEREDRLRALREARRVLRKEGFLFAAAISRFASLVDNLAHLGSISVPPVLADPAVERMVRQDLAGGPHRNPTSEAQYFTTAYFHHPDALAGEIRAAELELVDLLPVEGLGAFTAGFGQAWADGARRETLLSLVREVEREPTLLGVSPHLLAVARRNGDAR